MNLYLTQNKLVRYFTLTLLYIAQGLPIGLVTIALPAFLSERGATAGHIGTFVAISGLPWAFKVLAGPVMDRFSLLALGRRRPWVIVAQFGLFFSIVAMAFVPDVMNNLMVITWAAFLVNFFSALQDVAVDGMAIDVLPFEERGQANAFMAFGQVAGYSASGALTALLLSLYGIGAAAAIVAVGVGLISCWSIAVRENEGERLLPWSEGTAHARSLELQADSWRDIGSNLLKVVFLPTSVLLIVLTLFWRISDGFWITAAPVIVTRALGYAGTDYSYWTAITSFIAAVLGLLIGPMIDRRGAQTVFSVSLFGMAIVCLVAGLGTSLWAEPWFLLAVLTGYIFLTQFIFISFIALSMNVCWQMVAATQFAIFMAWSNLARSIGASIYGNIEPFLDQGWELLIMGGLCVVAGLFARMINTSGHRERLGQLE